MVPDKKLYSALCRLPAHQTSLDRRRMPPGHSADAIDSRGHRGGVIAARQSRNAPGIPRRLNLAWSPRGHHEHERIRGTVPVPNAIIASTLRRGPRT